MKVADKIPNAKAAGGSLPEGSVSDGEKASSKSGLQPSKCHKEELDYKPIPEYRQLALPGNNMLISPIRMTQRKIKLVDNKDDLTKKKIAKRWISTQVNIDYRAEFDGVMESKE